MAPNQGSKVTLGKADGRRGGETNAAPLSVGAQMGTEEHDGEHYIESRGLSGGGDQDMFSPQRSIHASPKN